MRWSDGVQHLSAVHQRILRLKRAGEAVVLLEPRIGVVLAVPGVTGNLDGSLYPACGGHADKSLRDRPD